MSLDKPQAIEVSKIVWCRRITVPTPDEFVPGTLYRAEVNGHTCGYWKCGAYQTGSTPFVPRLPGTLKNIQLENAKVGIELFYQG
jgi:hypothetical protein